MSNEHVDVEVAGLLEKVRPELTPALEQRAVAAIASAPPAPVRSRRRTVAIAAGAAVALFALGFVPIPLGRTKGALERALAAFDGCPSLYMREHGRANYGGKDWVFKRWMAPGDLSRFEAWTGGELRDLSLTGADFSVRYWPRSRTAIVEWWPSAADENESPSRRWVLETFRKDLAHHKDRPGHVGKEWRERSLWGAELDIIEITFDGRSRLRFDTDAATGRLLSWKYWTLQGGRWEPFSWTEEVVWDPDIPSDTWTWVPPKGTKVTYWDSWRSRVEHTLAADQTQDWQVTVHAIDVSDKGDLIITFSCKWTPEGRESPNYGAPEVEGVDNLGVTYHQQYPCGGVRGYRRAYLRPSESTIAPGGAETVTLTIRPSRGATAEDVLTFPDLPLPPPQDEVDMYAKKVVQY